LLQPGNQARNLLGMFMSLDQIADAHCPWLQAAKQKNAF
jgi:hypothetical protein